MKAEDLPVYQQRDRILDIFSRHRAVVIESPTGSGKTTQLPIILHKAGYSSSGIIGVTQPRRIAALSVCDYIAAQIGSTVPGKVGYKMRFEDQTNQETIIKIMTDGILLQELKADPDLTRYSMIMVDEAHERSLNIDFILGMLKRIQSRRSDFSILISSATINAEIFSAYFDDCPVVRIDAHTFPVALTYVPRQEGNDSLVSDVIDHVRKIVDSDDLGDILIFLPGERVIKECVSGIYGLPQRKELLVLPLYGRLSREEQEQVFVPAPKGMRKIIAATNIAETSVTIDGIRFVIDPGMAKLNYYNPQTFTSSLVEHSISKASCNQRKGRAGRTGPGACYRLYSRSDYEQRPLFTTEEIYRTDLSEVVLRMAELGIKEFESFDFLSPPDIKGIRGAVETLELLDALKPDRNLTPIGEMMARFPLLPRLSRIIVEAIYSYPSVVDESVIATAFLSANSPYLLPQGEELEARRAHHSFRTPHGDFVSYIELLRSFSKTKDKEKFCARSYLDLRVMNEIENIHRQLSEIVGELGVPMGSGGPVEDYLCSVARGLIQHVCRRAKNSSYSSLTTDRIYIHPGSVLFRESPRFIVAGEIVKTSRMFARSVSPIQEHWLGKISPILKRELSGIAQGQGDKSRSREPGRTRDAGPSRSRLKEPAKDRDTTWKIWIADQEFDLEPYKGKKKITVLPWEKIRVFRQLSAGIADIRIDHLQDLRGKITSKGMEVLVGSRLKTIVAALPYIDLDSGWLDSPPIHENLDSEENLKVICEHLYEILLPCKMKPAGKRIGFLCLESDGAIFWYRPVKSFNHAVSESMASLEALVDTAGENLNTELRLLFDKAYKRLSSIYES
ncbi:MAG: ATP-dependent RNA helicase [Spirochaetales bacterium]|nr:ATP-dependent RNA helicase [Spirochaetales bacterium]